MATQILYKDIPTNMAVHPIKGDLTVLTNVDDIKRSIMNLLYTEPYERFFNPNLGAGLKAYLFENISRDTEFVIREKIIETINNYEPRAELLEVDVKAMPDDNLYVATITFAIANSIIPITLDLILRRVR